MSPQERQILQPDDLLVLLVDLVQRGALCAAPVGGVVEGLLVRKSELGAHLVERAADVSAGDEGWAEVPGHTPQRQTSQWQKSDRRAWPS